jgi:hypothetical protein
MPTRAERAWISMRLLLPLRGNDQQFAPGDVIQVPPEVAVRLVEQAQATLHDPFLERDFELTPREWRASRGTAEPPPLPKSVASEHSGKRERAAGEARERAAAAAALAREYPL